MHIRQHTPEVAKRSDGIESCRDYKHDRNSAETGLMLKKPTAGQGWQVLFLQEGCCQPPAQHWPALGHTRNKDAGASGALHQVQEALYCCLPGVRTSGLSASC